MTRATTSRTPLNWHDAVKHVHIGQWATHTLQVLSPPVFMQPKPWLARRTQLTRRLCNLHPTASTTKMLLAGASLAVSTRDLAKPHLC